MRIKMQRGKVPGTFYAEIQADGNFQTLFTSETYNDKRDMEHAVGIVAAGHDDVVVIDATDHD